MLISDLERAGLRTAGVRAQRRIFLTTIDFEAFHFGEIGRWRAAMLAWADEAARRELPCVFFISVEDVLKLRTSDERAYKHLVEGLVALTQSGAELQPHNHCAYDGETGAPLQPGIPDLVPGYTKRPSMFFDVVHRNGIPIRTWIPRVVSALDDLRTAVRHPDAPIAFRPGGWDSGASSHEIADYVAALAHARIQYDSSATCGAYGTPSWHVGLPFGRNVFMVRGPIVEVASTMGWTCGRRMAAGANLAAAVRLARQPQAYLPPTRRGVFSPVLHFDHIVGMTDSPREAADQARWVVRTLDRLAAVLRMVPLTFSSLKLNSDSEACSDV